MALQAIEGKNVILRALKGVDMVPFACATSLEFYYDTEMIEKSTVSSAGFTEWAGGMGTWGLTLGTVTHILKPGYYTVFDTLLDALRKLGLLIELSFDDEAGNIKTITGTVLIPHTGLSAGVDGFSEDDVEMIGSGGFTLNTTLFTPDQTEYEVQRYPYTSSVGGETSVGNAILINREILSVEIDGVGKELILAGDPTDKQAKYVQGTGTILLPYPLSPTEWVLILYK